MIVSVVLPPMPYGARIVCGLLGTLLAGILNLVFRRARWRWQQFPAALAVSAVVILAASWAGLDSGNRTEYAFLGAVVGITCIRGSRPAQPLKDFPLRAIVVVATAAALGPVVGLAAHYLRYQLGRVRLADQWEIARSLDDGVVDSIAGAVLMAIMVAGSWDLWRSAAPKQGDVPASEAPVGGVGETRRPHAAEHPDVPPSEAPGG